MNRMSQSELQDAGSGIQQTEIPMRTVPYLMGRELKYHRSRRKGSAIGITGCRELRTYRNCGMTAGEYHRSGECDIERWQESETRNEYDAWPSRQFSIPAQIYGCE